MTQDQAPEKITLSGDNQTWSYALPRNQQKGSGNQNFEVVGAKNSTLYSGHGNDSIAVTGTKEKPVENFTFADSDGNTNISMGGVNKATLDIGGDLAAVTVKNSRDVSMQFGSERAVATIADLGAKEGSRGIIVSGVREAADHSVIAGLVDPEKVRLVVKPLDHGYLALEVSQVVPGGEPVPLLRAENMSAITLTETADGITNQFTLTDLQEIQKTFRDKGVTSATLTELEGMKLVKTASIPAKPSLNDTNKREQKR
jgi:hypothetical protein